MSRHSSARDVTLYDSNENKPAVVDGNFAPVRPPGESMKQRCFGF